MAVKRSFRFGTSRSRHRPRRSSKTARQIEAQGYDIFVLADHFESRWFPVGPAGVAVATVTSTLRIRSFLYSNNFRHLSGGRFEFGIGARYHLPEYDQAVIHLPDRRTGSTEAAKPLRS